MVGKNTLIREFVLSSRIAKICAGFTFCKKIHLYQDNALVKESGCGRTPWHYDDHHFSFEINDVIAAWILMFYIQLRWYPCSYHIICF